MCGEHSVIHSTCELPSGSSPHVRGAQNRRSGITMSAGIIPACAGSTTMQETSANNRRDHPRMCGEHSLHDAYIGGFMGSSPHVRGARTDSTALPRHVGIIPACAGSTGTVVRWRNGLRDHPRMCGEHIYVANPDILDPGSSPHVRGALGGDGLKRYTAGIIPACAGSTTVSMVVYATVRDHPRMCGEHRI